MREIDVKQIYDRLKQTILTALVDFPPDAHKLLSAAAKRETSDTAKFALDVIMKNIECAAKTRRPLCQDTGMAVIFLEVGQEVHFVGDSLTETINAAVSEAYLEGHFRMSVLDPITRVNTGNNTPAIIHTEIVNGSNVKVSFLPKGFGSENMTKTYMLTPAAGIDGVKNAVLDCVKSAGSGPCPPIIVGVGIGGTLDKAAEISKRALFRKLGAKSKYSYIAKLEDELLTAINATNIGVQGFGGNNTALSVAIETYPTHIAGLPVCVSLQCHSIRFGSFII